MATDREALKSVAGACLKQIVDGHRRVPVCPDNGCPAAQAFRWLNAATGWNKTPDEYMLIGEAHADSPATVQYQTRYRPQDLQNVIAAWPGTHPEGRPPKGRQVPVDAMMKLHWKHIRLG